ncbi:hypothetical protein [Streptomyces rhizosphaerihabitans]|uniref:hypothetical protein n=1 Tax=Streptomyces rhizosphaerihabitans TaxID=1266770 RepID=UPI0021C0FA45|nr:hypothetical protein [Streptomyces rhizosphaerihabitans]MCT9011816.1 hypothetical protein [Streptomyces rhizosphaerihabitans]
MHGRTLTNTAAGLAAAALFLGAAACAGGTGGRDEKGRKAAACVQGTYAWTGVVREQRLTGLADPITLEKGTDSVSGVIRPLKGVTYKPHVTSTAPGVRAADAIKALGRHLGTEEPLGGPSESAEPEKTPTHFDYDVGDLTGSYYAWNSVGLVEADFTYTCRGGAAKPVRGHVVTWETVGGGFLSCGDHVPEDPFRKTDVAARAAARKLCPAGSRAAQSA